LTIPSSFYIFIPMRSCLVFRFFVFGLWFPVFFLSGCDLLLPLVNKEMAEEKRMVGDDYSSNPRIAEVQTELKQLGYNSGSADGNMGFRTRKAVKIFQAAVGLPANGFIDRATYKSLANAVADRKVKAVKPTCRRIQEALKACGFDPGPADGRIGEKTRQAVKDFQKKKGLKIDGLVGGETWNMMAECGMSDIVVSDGG
jgi:peptidoglycan hydrolase-like protein with peptidoglycan-binding domain